MSDKFQKLRQVPVNPDFMNKNLNYNVTNSDLSDEIKSNNEDLDVNSDIDASDNELDNESENESNNESKEWIIPKLEPTLEPKKLPSDKLYCSLCDKPYRRSNTYNHHNSKSHLRCQNLVDRLTAVGIISE